MDEPDFLFLRASRVAIWGLGLMGGSLALAIKGKCASLIGIDMDPAVVELAREMAAVDMAYSVAQVEAHPLETLAGVDLLVLATPVRAILALLKELPRWFEQANLGAGPVVLDLGSTKVQIMAAMASLPERFDPLGGHPMCGKEKSSLRNAEAAIYREAPFALMALDRTSPRARMLGEEVVRAAGACALWMEPEQHDRWVAVTSHAPFLLASALAGSTPAECAPLVGPGFRSTARLAGSSSRMMIDILATNGDNVRAALAAFRERLALLEELLAEGSLGRLAMELDAGAEQYHTLIDDPK